MGKALLWVCLSVCCAETPAQGEARARIDQRSTTGPSEETPPREPSAVGQDGIPAHLEYRKRIESSQNIAPLESGVFGDDVNLYNGSTTFSVVDVDVPGNSALPVQAGRRHAVQTQPQSALSDYDARLAGVGNWDVDVPYLSSTHPDPAGWGAARCSSATVPPFGAGYFDRYEYWNGVSVYLPGRGDASVLGMLPEVPRPSDGGQYRLTTSSRDVFDCIAMKSGLSGEGFRMTTTSGQRYYFDVGVTRRDSTLAKPQARIDGSSSFVILARTRYILLASRVEDRFGNSVQYQYNAAGHPVRIWSNDGREIVLSYSEGRLSTATSHGRSWQYQYSATGDLVRVILPDGAQWQYAYAGNLRPRVGPQEAEGVWEWCSQEPPLVGLSYQVASTHPGGATAQFHFLNRRHYRNGVHATECVQRYYDNPNVPSYSLATPHYHDVLSLNRKVISGPGLSAMTWRYDYGIVPVPLWGTHTQAGTYPCTTCAQHKEVTVTNPDGTGVRRRFGNLHWVNDGRLLRTETIDAGGAVLRSETTEYLADIEAGSQSFHGDYGWLLVETADPSTARVRPVVRQIVAQQGRVFRWEVDRTCAVGSTVAFCFDAYANPTRVTKGSAPAP